jgi:hypothetical protein
MFGFEFWRAPLSLAAGGGGGGGRYDGEGRETGLVVGGGGGLGAGGRG